MTDDAFRGARRAVALVFLANGLLFGSWAARIPALQDRLELSEGSLGIALAFLALGALVAMPVAGTWAARAGSRRPTRVAFVGVAVAPALAATAPSYATLLAAAFVFGAVNGALDVVMNTQGTTVERRSGRLLLGRLHAAFSGGGLIGAATGAAAAGADVDPQVHLAIAGAVTFAAIFPLTGALLRGDGDRSRREPTFSRPEPALLALGFLAFCCLLAEGAAADWSAVYVDDDLRASAGVAGLAYAAFSALMFLGRLFADRLTERVGPVALLRAAGTLASAGLAVGLLGGTPGAAIAASRRWAPACRS
jgi:MFS family permease